VEQVAAGDGNLKPGLPVGVADKTVEVRIVSEELAVKPPQAGSRILLKVPCQAEYYRVCRLLVSGLAQRLGLPWDTIEDLKLAVSEACGLVAQEGTIGPECIVTVQLLVGEETLDILVDGPPGGGVETRVESDADELESTGMGLFFIQSLMDSVDYSVGRNQCAQIRMVKRVYEGDDEP